MTDRAQRRSRGRRSEWPRRVPLAMAGLTACVILLAVNGTVPAPEQTAMAQGMSTMAIRIDIDVQARGFERFGHRGRDSVEVNTDYRQGGLYSVIVAGAEVQLFSGDLMLDMTAASKNPNKAAAMLSLGREPTIEIVRADGVRNWDRGTCGSGRIPLVGPDLSRANLPEKKVSITRCQNNPSRGLFWYWLPQVAVRDPGGPDIVDGCKKGRGESPSLQQVQWHRYYEEGLARSKTACQGSDLRDTRSRESGLFIGSFSWSDLEAGTRIDLATDYDTPTKSRSLYPDTDETRIHISAALEPQMTDLELIVLSPAYDSWRPEAGLNERTIGNEITIDAKLQHPGGGVPNVKARKIIFELTGTSREPGVALNFPLAAATPGDFDLQFSPTSNPPDRYIISGTGNQKAETVPGQYTSASIAVSSFDWGAWSTLTVTAELENGRRVTGHLESPSGTTQILLPKRAKDSKIADSWKQQVGVSLPDLDDSETGPAGDSSKGDGFSLYEEYRGFYVAGQHVAGDPKKMDFFVRNYIGVDAEPGIILFTDLTGAAVHAKLLDSEFDRQSRVMNANRRQGPHVDPQAAGSFEQTQGQHGVFLETQAGLDGGLTVFAEAGVRGRPVIAMSANLQPRNSLTGMTTSENVPLSDLAFAYDRAVAHELLHTVGAEEHGKGDGMATFYFHFGDDPQNASGKSYFSFSRQLAGETYLGFTPLPGLLDPKTITDEATGRDLASMKEGDMMMARERERPDRYPDLLTAARKFLADRSGYNIPWTAEQLAEHDLDSLVSDQFALSPYIGAEHGECSGDELCVMRYYFARVYKKKDTNDTFYYISDTRTERAGRGLCRSPAGTGINDKDRNKPQPRYGNAADKRGACAASIIFNDALPLISDAIPTEPPR